MGRIEISVNRYCEHNSEGGEERADTYIKCKWSEAVAPNQLRKKIVLTSINT